MRWATLILAGALVLTACSSRSPDLPTGTGSVPAGVSEAAADTGGAGRAADGELYPDVIAATATRDADGSWQVTATLSSPYDSAERYADAWRVLAPDGTELGIRELTHDHAGEQPFTRSLAGVAIPAGVDVVTVEGRDQISGWGGTTVDVELQP